MAVMRHPYSGAREDDVPYSREALLSALDEPSVAPPPMKTRPRVPAPGAQERLTAPGGYRVTSGVDPQTGSRMPIERRESTYSGDVAESSPVKTVVPGSESRSPGRFYRPGEEPDERGAFDPYTLPDLGETRTRTPTTPYTVEDYSNFEGARLTGQGEQTDAADPYTLPETTPVRGAVPRPTFRPGAAAVGQGQSYFENLIAHDTAPESYLPGYNPREGARAYDGGKQAPQPDQLSPQMQSVIRGSYGLDVNGLSEEDVNQLIEMGWVYGETAPPGYEYSDDGLIKKSGSVLRTIGRIGAIALPVVATIATGGVASPWLAAAIGAGTGAGSAALSGGGTREILTGAGLGAASGGLGAAGAGLSTGARIATQAGLGAAGGALTGGGVPGALLGAGVGAANARFSGAGSGPTTTGQALTNAAIEAGTWGLDSALAPDDIGGLVDPETGAAATGTAPRHGAPATPTTPPVGGGLPPPGPTGTPPGFLSPEELAAVGAADAAANQGPLGPPVAPMEGFNLDREQDPSFSVKDAFAAAVRAPGIPPPPGEDKAALGAWFEQHVLPSIEAQGHTVNWVDGDKVNITGPQGTGTIDWYRGAGAPGGALAWQPEGGAGDAGGAGEGGTFQGSGATTLQDGFSAVQGMVGPDASIADMEAAITAAFQDVPGFEDAYKESVKINGQWSDLVGSYGGANPTWQLMPKNDGAGATTTAGPGGLSGGGAGLAGYANLAPGVSLAAPLGRSDVLARIMEEIRRIQSGAPPRDALLAELGAE